MSNMQTTVLRDNMGRTIHPQGDGSRVLIGRIGCHKGVVDPNSRATFTDLGRPVGPHTSVDGLLRNSPEREKIFREEPYSH